MVDNVVAAYNSGDYTVFSRDFDLNLKTGISPDNFPQTRQFLMTHLGPYRSRQVSSIQAGDGTITIVYLAQFEKSRSATIRAVFRDTPDAAGRHLLDGLVFDAPELRQ